MALVKIPIPAGVDYTAEGSSSTSQALVPVLPEQWARVPTLERRRVCQFTTAVHTAVNKAQSHLELLQNAIEDWFSEFRSSAGSQASVNIVKSTTPSQSSYYNKKLISDSEDVLEIIGIGQDLPAKVYRHVMEQGVAVPYLGADEVLHEVINLLGKMEADRQETEKCIIDERKRVKELSDKVDLLSEAKQLQLPDAVQSEHEACANDIVELQWHVAHRTKERIKVRKREHKVNILNERLKDEISFVHEHKPLVAEKLDLELSSVVRIKDAKKETYSQLEVTKERCSNVTEKNRTAHDKANSERAQMQYELDQCNRQLDKAKKTLENSRQRFDKLNKGIGDTKAKITKNQQEMEVLNSENRTASTEEEIIQNRVDSLKRQIHAQENHCRALDEENTELRRNYDELKESQENQRSELQKIVDREDDRFNFFRRENEEVEMECDDMTQNMKECAEQKEADMKNKARIHRELENTAAQMGATMTDFTKLANEHAQIREKLEHEERKIRQLEDTLRSTITQLQKQIEDEIYSREQIQTRMKTDSQDLTQSKEEAKIKRKRMKKMVEEIEKAVKSMTHKVNKLQAESDIRAAKVAELRSALDSLAAEHQNMLDDLGGQLAVLEPKHDDIENNLKKIGAKLDELTWQTDMMNKKLEDMRDSTIMINRSKDKLETAIQLLEDQLKELTFLMQAQQRKEDSLEYNTNALLARIDESDRKHKVLCQERDITLAGLLEKLESSKSQNVGLAGRYRTLQTEFYEMKEKLLDVANEQVQLEAAIGDVKQLQRLQQKLYGALKLFLTYRNAYINQERDRMEKEASYNSYKVEALQTEMNCSIEEITTFLNEQMENLMLGKRSRDTTDDNTT